jgi:hypothetical protein
MAGSAYQIGRVSRCLEVLRQIVYASSDWINGTRCLRNIIEFEVEPLFLPVGQRENDVGGVSRGEAQPRLGANLSMSLDDRVSPRYQTPWSLNRFLLRQYGLKQQDNRRSVAVA